MRLEQVNAAASIQANATGLEGTRGDLTLVTISLVRMDGRDMSQLVPDRDEWFEISHSFPRPNWTEIDRWIQANVDETHASAAWDEATAHWLRRIQAQHKPRYHFAASKYIHLLSPHTPSECARMLEMAERIYGRIAFVLGSLAAPQHCKLVVLRFREAEEYYHYIAHFYRDEGEYPMSGGVFLSEGFPHFVCLADQFEQFISTFAHELSHLLVRHLPLPAWINEGVAMTFEADFGYSHLPSSEEIEKHRKHWTEETIQAFWSGEIYQSPGETFDLGYGLAAVLFDIIRKELQPPPDAFRAFIQNADRSDGGAAAARNHLRVELAELVEEFLGPGNWSPRVAS